MPPASYANAFLVTFLFDIVTQPKLPACLAQADCTPNPIIPYSIIVLANHGIRRANQVPLDLHSEDRTSSVAFLSATWAGQFEEQDI